MNLRTVVLIAVVLPLLAAAPLHAADEWYAGAGLAAQHVNFDPNYTFYNGSPSEQYHDPATGIGAVLIAGQRFDPGKRFSLGWQGTVTLNHFAWSLSIPAEPAELRYAMPATFVASVVPAVRLSPALSLFGSIGGGAARVTERKTSPNSSTYDYRAFDRVFALGGGMRVKASARTDVLVQYDYLRAAAFSYDTVTPAGVLVERVQDAPRSHSVTFGGVFRF